MKATEANLLKFLKKSPQFVISIHQRNYSWIAAQCRLLWADLMRAGRDEKISAHFTGSIVYVERGLSTVTSQEASLVIDGQQHLTTSTLLIAALAKHFETQGLGELLESVSKLDPCVSEEFLNLYVAYKAKTNFVDVVPQARRLLLVLNVGLADIEDPKDSCRDVAAISRWGNGDVEIGLSSADELPYVMGLIHQSFDYQMSNLQDA